MGICCPIDSFISRCCRVTVLKDKQTRKSKGVAFILFLKKEDAQKCVSETNMKEVEFNTEKLIND